MKEFGLLEAKIINIIKKSTKKEKIMMFCICLSMHNDLKIRRVIELLYLDDETIVELKEYDPECEKL